MSFLKSLTKWGHLYECGRIDAEEFVGKLAEYCAYDGHANLKDAADVAALIPPPLREMVRKQINTALSPEYIRRSICSGNWPEGERRAADLRVTARERAWAEALKPFVS